MRRSWLRLFAVLLSLSLVAAACGDDDDSDTDAGGTTTTGAPADRGNVDGTLKVGSLLPETGDLAFLGPPMIKGVEMAIRDINAAGGVFGKDVEHVQADDGTDPDVAATAIGPLLTSDKIDVLVGAAATGVTQAVVDRVSGALVPQCSPSNTGSNLTAESSTDPADDYYFRTPPADDLQALALADLIVDDGHETVAIVTLNNEYGRGFAEHLAPALEEAGAEVVLDFGYDEKATTFDAEAQRVLDADADAVALVAYPDTGSKVIAAMIEAGVGPDDLPMYVTDGLQSTALAGAVDPDDASVLEGVKGTVPSAAPPTGAAFFPDAFAEFAPDVDTIYSAHAYDCTVIFALAAAIADSDAGPDIQAEVVGVTSVGEKCSTFEECIALVEAGTDIDYDGAAGALEFTDAGEPGAGTYDIWVFDAEGGTETLDSVDVSGAAA